jgi:hypothetical protein
MFDPLDTADITRAMDTFQDDEVMRNRCSKNGLTKVVSYRPEEVFRSLTSAYSKAILEGGSLQTRAL